MTPLYNVWISALLMDCTPMSLTSPSANGEYSLSSDAHEGYHVSAWVYSA